MAYQTTPGGTWDYTATQPIILADLPIGGQIRKVALQAPKNGFFYVVDRSNGRLISARPFLPMSAAADTPPGLPISWAYAVDPATGRPVENPQARYRGAAALVHPGPFGAHNWHPMSFSPQTGLVYLPAQDMAFGYQHDAAFVAHEGFGNNLGLAIQPLTADLAVRAAIKAASRGVLLAWDPIAQREVWRADRRGPWNGGTLARAGGLVFQGTGDGQFMAHDARTSEVVWSTETLAATLAGPISYEIGGEQYVAVLGGYVSGGVLPDLRRSVRLHDATAWRRAVMDGELAPLGMPRFDRHVSADDGELIRAYVARQAAMLYAAEHTPAVTSAAERR